MYNIIFVGNLGKNIPIFFGIVISRIKNLVETFVAQGSRFIEAQ